MTTDTPLIPPAAFPKIHGERRFRRAVECVVVFGLLPPALYFGRRHLAFHVVPLLWLAAGLCWLVLRRCGSEARWRPPTHQSAIRIVLSILSLFLVPAVYCSLDDFKALGALDVDQDADQEPAAGISTP